MFSVFRERNEGIISTNKNKIMKFTLPDLETNYSLNNQWNWYWR